MIKKKITISCIREVVKAAALNELEYLIVGVPASREGLASPLSSCGNV